MTKSPMQSDALVRCCQCVAIVLQSMRVRGHACFSREPTFVSEASGGKTGDEYIDGGGEEGGAIILYTNPRSNCKLPANDVGTVMLVKKAE